MVSSETGANSGWVGRSGLFSVYVVESGGLCKIGYAKNPQKRISNIRANSPLKIELVFLALFENVSFAAHVEKGAHWILDDLRSHGEWFTVSPELAMAAIAKTIHHQGVEKFWSSTHPGFEAFVKLGLYNERLAA